MALDDDQPLSGAQFTRHVGADPEKWAAEFMKNATCDVALSNTELVAFVTAWFRDAMEAAVKAARDGRLQALLSRNVVHREVDPLKPMENTALQDCLAGLRLALAAQLRGDDQAVLDILALNIKRLGIITSE